MYIESEEEAKMLLLKMMQAQALLPRGDNHKKRARYMVLPGVLLGEGSFGRVSKGLDLVTKQPVAMKFIQVPDARTKLEVLEEIGVMRALAQE